MLHTTIRAIVPRVFQLRVPGSGVFLLLDRRVTLIDAGPPGSAAGILRALRLLGHTADDVDQIVITHYHLDHLGGLAGLLRHVPARVAIHAIEAPYATGERSLPLPLSVRMPGRLRPALQRLAGARPVRIDTLLRHGDQLPVLGGMRVIDTPGHTPGHIALHLPELGLLIAGDALQVRRGTLAPPARLVTEDWRQALRSLRTLAAIEFETLALSHFPPQRGAFGQRLLALADGAR